MRVPGIAVITGRGDKTGSGFHQPARQKQTLPNGIAPVGVLGLVRFFGKVERLLHARRQYHLQGFLPESVHLRVLCAFDRVAVIVIDYVQEHPAVFYRGEC